MLDGRRVYCPRHHAHERALPGDVCAERAARARRRGIARRAHPVHDLPADAGFDRASSRPRFRCSRIARRAGETGGAASCALADAAPAWASD